MKLLHYPHAPYSRKVLLAAYEKQLSFESEVVQPFDRPAKERLRALHPFATVPLLVDGEDVLTESSVIVEWLDVATAHGPKLVPDDVHAALRARALDRFADANLMVPTVYLAWSLRKPVDQQNADKILEHRTQVDKALGVVERRLDTAAFVAGATLTMADLSPIAALSCLLSDGSLDGLTRFPRVAHWYEGVVARPSFQRILDDCTRVPLPPGF